ncbi:hypothetical protein [Halorubrum sp. SD612]|uniref:hypothetical protein n=1 Tax=Halorubrum sp. SD612 TaxID=1855863 RepID=UPI000A2DB2F6|nr:hypothetical protein [Halorubrum sp. SD612]OTF08910.1 hypothetical protein B9G38_08805 [Halorubrum sp. SD612]
MTDRDTGPNRDGRDAPPAAVAITAGAALFNEGRFVAAREVWSGVRRPPDGDESDDGERLRRGLAAAAAAAHRALEDDPSEGAERADDALAALASVGDSRGVALAPVREWAERLASTPIDPDPATAPRIRVDGEAPTFDGLPLAAAGIAAPALARAGDPGDPEALASAADFAREERGTGRTVFSELLFAYLRTPDARPQVAARLSDRVDREERRRRDVEGLF